MASSSKRSAMSTGVQGKRPAAAENVPAKVPTIAGKKRVALGDISNAGRGPAKAPAKSAMKTHPTTTSINKRAPTATTLRNSTSRRTSLTPSVSQKTISRTNGTVTTTTKPTIPSTIGTSSFSRKTGTTSSRENNITVLVPCRTLVPQSDSVSADETMSMCDSMKSPNFEYIDNDDSNLVASLERRANANLRISDDISPVVSKWREVATQMEIEEVQDVDKESEDPQMCTTLVCDIYKHLRFAETKKRPSTNFMETVQTDVNASMRAILVDWLVEVAEEYRLIPDTLYLTINYIDRYLSGNEINRQRLQLLGVACMLIASKYEEICAPQVEEFCYITDNTYFKDEVLQMETQVLNYLKFEMTAPTIKCFLRRFARAAQLCEGAPLLQLEFLASYIAELSLLEYNLLCYSPSHIAASSIFLAKFILHPTKNPWSGTLSHYTLYKPSELQECVNSLHRLFCNGPGSNLPAIREKYSQHKYKFVAKRYCPTTIPSEFFEDAAI